MLNDLKFFPGPDFCHESTFESYFESRCFSLKNILIVITAGGCTFLHAFLVPSLCQEQRSASHRV